MKWNPKQLVALKLLSDHSKKYYLFYGGSRSGKTFLTVHAIRVRANKYPNSKHLIARYSFANAKKTIWMQTILPEFKQDQANGFCKINLAEGIIKYKNGSTVRLGGLEPSTIDSVLGSEYGTIFVNEANENKYETIETLYSRLNDTAQDYDGKQIPLKFICDLNPTVDRHWSNLLFRRGLDPVTMKPKQNFSQYCYLHFSPEDNRENLAMGYIEDLKNLSPAKRKRFFEGEYGSYDGLVFRIDDAIHLIDDFKIHPEWKKIRSIDFGYTHPFVCLWIAYDKANDCAYVYKEYSIKNRTVNEHARHLKDLSGNEIYDVTICDHDAEDRATLEEHGINTTPANKEVLSGIDNVIDLLDENRETGKRTRVKIFRSCSSLINCLYSYRWKKSEDSNRNAKDREVVKADDDEADALRYGLMELFPIQSIDYSLDERYRGNIY